MSEIYLQALQSFRQGKLDESYRQLLTIRNPELHTAQYHQLLAFIALKNNKRKQALRHMQDCLQSNPVDLDILQNLARFFLQQGQLKTARQVYLRILADDHDNLEANQNLGRIYNDLNQPGMAHQYFKHALKQDAGNFQVYFGLGVVCRKTNKIKAAEEYFKKASELNPEYTHSFIQLGVLAHLQKQPQQALKYFRQALEYNTDNLEALDCLGKTEAQLKQYASAAGSFRRIISLKPDSVSAWVSLAEILRLQRQYDECQKLLDRAEKRFPANEQLQLKQAALLNDVGQYSSAETKLRSILDKTGYDAAVCNLLGASLWQQGRYTEALKQFEVVLGLQPDNAEAHFNKSFMLLLLGDYRQGWQEYEWRLQYFKPHAPEKFPEHKRWQGEDLNGKKLIICHEQGVGDFFLFARYLKLLKPKAGHLYFVARPGTKSFFDDMPACEAILNTDPLPDYDYHIPLPSLPLMFDTTVESIPGAFPYLPVNENRLRAMQQLVKEDSSLKVGIVWAGNPNNPIDGRRSCAFADLKGLLAVDNTCFYSLQLGPRAAEMDSVQVQDLGDSLQDFADTAAAIELLDLVIGVDTATVHLAGALGKPVFVALPFVPPDWRWLLEREDSPWYPTVKLFRQDTDRRWQPVMEKIKGELEVLAATRKIRGEF